MCPLFFSSARQTLVGLIASCSFLTALTGAAMAQNGYVAAIAYSQSTGKIGYTARQARTEQQARQLALRMVGAPDAKVYTWARDQWVAVATVDGVIGTAGFARGYSADEAQQKALAECGKRAKGRAYRVALCVHSSGMRPRELRHVAGKPATSRTGFFAAIAYSPSTGKIGHTAAEAKTKEAAHALALKKCQAPDAKVWMWGDQWVAIAVVEGGKGTAGFGPGATREAAEKAALVQCRKFGHGAPCKIAISIYSAGEPAAVAAKGAATKTAGAQPARNDRTVNPAGAAESAAASNGVGNP